MTSSEELNRSIGQRIRDVRRAKGFSLLDVEEASGGEFKASVLGAYERGERSISVSRLMRLASVYGTHPAELLPEEDRGRSVVVDLTAVEHLDRDRAEVLDGFLAAIQRMRHDPDTTALTVRRSDLEVLSALLGEELSDEEVPSTD